MLHNTSTSAPFRWPFLLALLTISLAISAQTKTPPAGSPASYEHPDYGALVKLYASTNGKQWANTSGWAEGAKATDCTPCQWFGIRCNDEGRVTEIDLRNNNLTGTLPAGLKAFSELNRLVLSDNAISGNIPSWIAETHQLEELRLDHNTFSGPIPLNLGKLGQLEYLDLAGNELSGAIPTSLGKTPLSVLSLSNNQLTGEIPGLLGKTANLAILLLDHNQLTGEVPASLGGLAKLTSLHLEHNQLSGGIPESFGQLINLRVLVANDNILDGQITPDFSACTHLRRLRLNNNTLMGVIPPSLAVITSLHSVDLSNNQLAGPVPAEIAGLPALRTFLAHDNQLTDCPANLMVWCGSAINHSFARNRKLPWFGETKNLCTASPKDTPPCDPDNDSSTKNQGIFNEFCACVEAGEKADISQMEISSQQLTEPRVYPNPVLRNQPIGLLFPDVKTTYQLTVLSLEGKVILEKTLPGTTTSLDHNSLPAGAYFLSIQTDEDRWVKKVVVQ